MTTGTDDYVWEDVLERLDVTLDDFPDFGTLIERLSDALGRPASARQIDLSAGILQAQQFRAADLGYSVSRFVRQGRDVTVLRDIRGRFLAQTTLPVGDLRSTRRTGVGTIAAALRRGAG